ncbi:microsomal glutathione S-transferase 1-like [Chironomus tepperi]|uniref:microsomal glutathione S-transferase 1-like n=1 Tax=Chironomus tepperi TaxID=113505 RepID=UPI00391EF215
MAIFTYDNVALRVYITWGGLLLIKMLLMSFLTIINRIRKGAVENPEDATGNFEIKKDEDVERMRRAHLNDLENIPAFLLAALMYIITDPNPIVASWLIRVAVLSRIFYTVVYAIYPIRQPARAICFFTMLGITFFMIIWSMTVFFHY